MEPSSNHRFLFFFLVAKISELETNLRDTQEDLNVLQESFNQEISELSARTRRELDRDREQMETKIIALTRENETLKAEVCNLFGLEA